MKKTTYTKTFVSEGKLHIQVRTRTEIDLKAVKKANDLREMYAKLGLPSKVGA